MSHVTGTLRLRQVARLLRDASPELRKELYAGIRKPLKPFTAQVRAEVPSSVPSGYAPVLAPSIKVSLATGLRGGGLGYTFEVYAKGRKEERDVRAVNAGILRHKEWGHEPWHSQHVRGGFVDRPVEQLGQQIAKEADAAVEKVAAKIEKG